jgi:hypothetical protein
VGWLGGTFVVPPCLPTFQLRILLLKQLVGRWL